MGKATKALKEFIDGIPDSKLTGFSVGSGTIHKTTEFRLDMQGVRNLPLLRVGPGFLRNTALTFDLGFDSVAVWSPDDL